MTSSVGATWLVSMFLQCRGAGLVSKYQVTGVNVLIYPTEEAVLMDVSMWLYVDKESMIFDSGKMSVLDKLLVNLKREDHRVLIYSQMTRMIDLLEEFMGYRRYRYIRLDGSSRISDRRDMVADFQSK